MSDVKERVEAILKEQFGAQLYSEIAKNDGSINTVADSLDWFELIRSCEDEFGIEISDAATVDMKTVDDIVEYIEGMSREPAHGAH